MYKYVNSLLIFFLNKYTIFHTQIIKASLSVLEESNTQLWWAGKQLEKEKKLFEYIGRNEKTKIVAKLQKVIAF